MVQQGVAKGRPGRPIYVTASAFLALAWLFFLVAALRVQADPVPHLGYGFNVAPWNTGLIQSMGFNWMKAFDAPGSPQPVRILLRVAADAGDMGNLPAFGQQIYQLALNNGANIDAYEIGNEVNLDASYGWNAPPIAADYATLLCVAYEKIKQADPTAIVVSAGLAPTGRVQGTWKGHPGHNGMYQDEREYLIEFLAAGGADCLDVAGYHPYGFSADYDAEPDAPSADPTQNCANGFCFRGAEKFYEVMQANGAGDKKMWVTEFGWIVQPPEECLDDPSWQGRLWQIVSEQKQASNLQGAFQYAGANWPWMGAMFVFNLNFNAPGWYPLCEQMRYYAVEDRPAEAALAAMPKNPATLGPRLLVSPAALSWLVDVDEQPLTFTSTLNLANGGWQSTNYTVTADTSAAIIPTIANPTGALPPTALVPVWLTVAISQPLGVYTGTLTVAAPPGTAGAPQTIPLELHVLPEVYRTYLPTITRP
ncbi:MAG: hypothetical protein L0332_33715 [Chloroflexi bacterium]|nr:hypothetical protein [Chloroflexota bacterium]MCI0578770.1 hypothetical protein [Chloroflexota bacterium]MCI0648733.1 hypothetical protein [Chloroflexota bacterium]MCI0731661.1 hypothetical protein [Chloroflexota bacterium]